MRWSWGCFALFGERFDVLSRGLRTKMVHASESGMGLVAVVTVIGLVFVDYNQCVSKSSLWEKWWTKRQESCVKHSGTKPEGVLLAFSFTG